VARESNSIAARAVAMHGAVLLRTRATLLAAAAASTRCPGPVARGLPSEVLDIYNSRFLPLGTPTPDRSGPTTGNAAPRPAPDEKSVGALWGELKVVYGNEDLALQAVRQNPTVVHPLYTTKAGMKESKAALVDVFGSEDGALSIMLKNPAVLQCGASLRATDADQIESVANFRQFADSIPPSASVGALAALLAVGLLNIALSNADGRGGALADSFVSVANPVLGAAGASLFLGALALAITANERAPSAEPRE
jgi:hypothetical protein